ncbi:Hypothetical predicted protein [Podarcis lilfordi]|nr:Hypothetical predicted protein [Podarcis lilfordi]
MQLMPRFLSLSLPLCRTLEETSRQEGQMGGELCVIKGLLTLPCSGLPNLTGSPDIFDTELRLAIFWKIFCCSVC